MATGSVDLSVQTGGPVRGGAAAAVRTVCILGVCTSGTAGTLYRPGDPSSAAAQLGRGPAAEECAALLAAGGTPPYVLPVEPTLAGAVSTTAHTGTGLATVVAAAAPHVTVVATCTTPGAIGTAGFKFNVGGQGNGAEVLSVGPAPWVCRVPGTFLSLSFAAANYVQGETLGFNVDATQTASAGWVGVVTETASPLDWYELQLTVTKGGAKGTAVLTPSLDFGISTLPPIPIPSSGTITLPQLGLVLTCDSAPGNFVAGDVYTILTAPPSYASTSVTSSVNTLITASPKLGVVHSNVMPVSASDAHAHALAMNGAMATALAAGFDWDGITECPAKAVSGQSLGSIVISGGAAIRDTADDDATIRTAAMGKDYKRCAVNVDMYRLSSAAQAGAPALLRPLGWVAALGVALTDPATGIAAHKRGALPIQAIALGPVSATVPARIGRDERRQGGLLDELYYNTAQTSIGNGEQAYFAITKGVAGYKNMTQDSSYVSFAAVRVLNALLAALRPACDHYLGDDEATNGDGTIAEKDRLAISADLDAVAKRATGLLPGGDFATPQASFATAYVLPTSQLGTAPKRLDVAFSLQTRGEITSISGVINFSGAGATLNLGA